MPVAHLAEGGVLERHHRGARGEIERHAKLHDSVEGGDASGPARDRASAEFGQQRAHEDLGVQRSLGLTQPAGMAQVMRTHAQGAQRSLGPHLSARAEVSAERERLDVQGAQSPQ